MNIEKLSAPSAKRGKKYSEAVDSRWLIGSDIPEGVKNLVVQDANDVDAAKGKCQFVFSALEMDKEKLTAKVIRIPARADVDLEVAENLIIELYSKN